MSENEVTLIFKTSV